MAQIYYKKSWNCNKTKHLVPLIKSVNIFYVMLREVVGWSGDLAKESDALVDH